MSIIKGPFASTIVEFVNNYPVVDYDDFKEKILSIYELNSKSEDWMFHYMSAFRDRLTRIFGRWKTENIPSLIMSIIEDHIVNGVMGPYSFLFDTLGCWKEGETYAVSTYMKLDDVHVPISTNSSWVLGLPTESDPDGGGSAFWRTLPSPVKEIGVSKDLPREIEKAVDKFVGTVMAFQLPVHHVREIASVSGHLLTSIYVSDFWREGGFLGEKLGRVSAGRVFYSISDHSESLITTDFFPLVKKLPLMYNLMRNGALPALPMPMGRKRWPICYNHGTDKLGHLEEGVLKPARRRSRWAEYPCWMWDYSRLCGPMRGLRWLHERDILLNRKHVVVECEETLF